MNHIPDNRTPVRLFGLRKGRGIYGGLNIQNAFQLSGMCFFDMARIPVI